MRIQSSVDQILMYGFSLLVTGIVAAVLYFYVAVPSTIPSSQCNFGSYLSCRAIVVGSNSLGTGATLLLTNIQQYAIENPSVTINITGVGNYTGSCYPSFVKPGGIIECTVTIDKQINQNELRSGEVYISTSVCTQMGSGCGSPLQQTYGGTFSTTISTFVPPPQCSVALSVANSTQSSQGGKDLLTANVKISGEDIAGATVGFISDNGGVGINPQYSNTNSDGNATSYASSTSANGAVLVTASFGGCSDSQTINFVTPT